MTDTLLPRIVVVMDFPDELIEQMRAAAPGYRVERHFPDVPDSVWGDTEVLYTLRKFPTPEQAPRLRWIQLHFAGVERALQHPIVKLEDITLTSASGIHATPIAEYCMAMMLAFNLKLPLMLKNQHKAYWQEKPHDVFLPRPLRGQTLGIAGYGSIGREVARLASGFGMKLLATKHDAKRPEDTDYHEAGLGDPTGDLPERIYPWQALASMAKECDFIVIATPLTPETHHLVNADVLSAMKPTAVLINIARGGVVDEAALTAALTAGDIGGAALDVFEEEPLPATSPLWALGNVIISPHISGNNVDYYKRAAALFIENLRRYAEQRPLLNRIDRTRGY
ncbi:MAG: D-2-hydroxyacid dehydrogenase [Armatimonadetes bacterium]|nr:D-2-hydroxyacid dehydrogenase [Anaerolineae bacterium]